MDFILQYIDILLSLSIVLFILFNNKKISLLEQRIIDLEKKEERV